MISIALAFSVKFQRHILSLIQSYTIIFFEIFFSSEICGDLNLKFLTQRNIIENYKYSKSLYILWVEST